MLTFDAKEASPRCCRVDAPGQDGHLLKAGMLVDVACNAPESSVSGWNGQEVRGLWNKHPKSQVCSEGERYCSCGQNAPDLCGMPRSALEVAVQENSPVISQ